MRMTKRERKMRMRHLKRMYRMEVREMKRKNRVSGQYMKRVVFIMLLAAFVFTVTMTILFVRTGTEPSTLIEKVFQFLSVEGGAMALIKSVKTVARKNKNEEQGEKEEVSG